MIKIINYIIYNIIRLLFIIIIIFIFGYGVVNISNIIYSFIFIFVLLFIYLTTEKIIFNIDNIIGNKLSNFFYINERMKKNEKKCLNKKKLLKNINKKQTYEISQKKINIVKKYI